MPRLRSTLPQAQIVNMKVKLFCHYRLQGFGNGQAMSMAGIRSTSPDYELIKQVSAFKNAKKPHQALPRNNDGRKTNV